MRLHIGQISDALAEHIGELEARLDRFGSRTSPLSLHRKEFGDKHFAFVDIDLDAKGYAALSRALNGLVFRQSKLTVNEAQPSYPDRMKLVNLERQSPKDAVVLNPEQKKRWLSRGSREIDVFHAKMRESADVRQEPTFRVKYKGEIRKPKMRKRKLWGVEKRPLDRLVTYFVDGEWRDAENRAVEIVDKLHDEQAQAERLAASYVEQQQAGYLSDSDFDDFKENARELDEVESDNEIEVVPTSGNVVPRASQLQLSEDEEDEEDDQLENDLPPSTVGQPFKFFGTAEDETPEYGENTTESLRTALNVETPFSLFGTSAPSAPAPPVAEPVPEPPKLGLFFMHESPYLRSQAQAAKLVAEFDAKAWETEFYEKRGEWNQNLRKRRRDAVRMGRKMGKKRGE